MQRRRVYLDFNASAPLLPAARNAMARALDNMPADFSNPASVHEDGRRARRVLDDLREAIGGASGFHPRDCVLTSGGTEANALALHQRKGLAADSLVTSYIEHPSVWKAAETFAREGESVAWIRPSQTGHIGPEEVLQAIPPESSRPFVSVQAANHETGAVHGLAGIIQAVHDRGGIVHVDAVQGFGKMDVSAWRNADLASIAAHKIGGPKGIGALLFRTGLPMTPLQRGGAQEAGLRAGTPSPLLAVGFLAAIREIPSRLAERTALQALRDGLEAHLMLAASRVGRIAQANAAEPRLEHVLNISLDGLRGDELCAALDLLGVSVSSGAACSAGTSEPSMVITTLFGVERARGAVRVSLGLSTTRDDLEEARRAFDQVLMASSSQ